METGKGLALLEPRGSDVEALGPRYLKGPSQGSSVLGNSTDITRLAFFVVEVAEYRKPNQSSLNTHKRHVQSDVVVLPQLYQSHL